MQYTIYLDTHVMTVQHAVTDAFGNQIACLSEHHNRPGQTTFTIEMDDDRHVRDCDMYMTREDALNKIREYHKITLENPLEYCDICGESVSFDGKCITI